jgi:hypothetical protein
MYPQWKLKWGHSTVPTEYSVKPMGDAISPNQTAKLKQFVDLLESGERNSPVCKMHSSETDFKGPSRSSA